MKSKSFIVLYAKHLKNSIAFYQDLFDATVTQHSDNYADLNLPNGFHFGLWQSDAKSLSHEKREVACEIAIEVENQDALMQTYQAWLKKKVNIVQKPTQMHFGNNFIAQDVDGHYLRVVSPV